MQVENKIKKIKEFLETSDQNFKFWEEFGFLEGLEDFNIEDKKALIAKLEEMKTLLLESPFELVKEVETVMFAIIRRAFTAHNYLIKSCKNTLAYVLSNKQKLIDMSSSSFNAIDGEAEFCALMAEQISNLKL